MMNFSFTNLLKTNISGNFKRLMFTILMVCLLVFSAVLSSAQSITYNSGANVFPVGSPITPIAPTNSSSVGAYSFETFNGRIDQDPLFMNYPTGSAVTQSGTVYVLERITYPNANPNQLYSVTPTGLASGSPVSTSATIINSGYTSPKGIALDKNYIYITEQGVAGLKRMPIGGTTTTSFGTGIISPYGIAIDKYGNIFVTDLGDNRVKKILAGTTNAVTFGPAFTQPIGLATDNNGNVFVTDFTAKTITKLSATGTSLTVYTGLVGPRGIAVDNAGTIFFGDGQYTKRMPSGSTTAVVQRDGGANAIPFGISVDGRGVVFISDNGISNLTYHFPKGGYAITPALPAGLSFDNLTGTISGTPLEGTAATDYTITAYATNKASTTAVVNIKTTSSNADLANLTTNAGEISPVFDAATLSYSITTANPTITVTPITSDLSASVTVDGAAVLSGAASANIAVNIGANAIPVEVTAGDGTIKTYTLNVNRIVGLSSLLTNFGTLSPVFSSEVTTYGITTSSGSINITPTSPDPLSTIKVDGMTVASGATSDNFSLPYGTSPIQVEVTAADGVTKNTYTINITHPVTLSGLTLSSGTLTPVFNDLVNTYTATVSSSLTDLTITPTPNKPSSVITINGDVVNTSTTVPIAVGNNVFTIVITAVDGVTNATYTLTVFKPAAPTFSYDANLHTYSTGAAITPIAPIATSYVNITGYDGIKTIYGQAPVVSGPTAIAADGPGNVYHAKLASGNNSTIVKLPAGSFANYGSGFKLPNNMKTDAKGDIYIADNNFSSIQKIDPITNTHTTIGSGFSLPTGVDVDADGNIYVAELSSGFIKKIPIASGSNTPVTIIKGLGISYDVAIDPAGNIFVADFTNNKIYKLAAGTSIPAGGILGTSLPTVSGTFSGPSTIAFDGAGNMFVSCTTDKLITMVSPSGVQTTIASGFNNLFSLSKDGAGNVYATDYAAAKIYKIKPNGGYFIYPNLPVGLNFDNNTGVINGTPTAGTKATTYTITGYNVEGLYTSSTVNIKTIGADATLSGIVLNAGTLSPEFDSATTNYTATVGVSSLNIDPYITDPLATVTVNGNTTVQGTPLAVPLTIGNNPIVIVVTSSDGAATKTYNLDVTRVPLPSLSYSGPHTYSTGAAISPLVPTSSDVSAYAYSTTLTTIPSNVQAPEGIAVSDNGDLYITDNAYGSSSTIKKVSASGVTSTLSTGFNTPYSIALDPENNYYVADYARSPGVTKNGANITGITGSTSRAINIAVDYKGNIFYNPRTGGLKVMYVGASAPVDFSSGFDEPALGTDANGNLYAAEYTLRTLFKITPAGVKTQLATGLVEPTAVSVDGTGNIFMADASRISMVAAGSSTVTNLTPTLTFGGLAGISVDKKNNIFFTDRINALIHKLSPIGGYFISPNLPLGLSFNNATGEITGTPTVSTPLKTYTVTAYNNYGNESTTIQLKTISTEARLASLTLSTGVLSPAFASETTDYTADVTASTFTLTPTALDPFSTITVNGTDVATGTASTAIPLAFGANNIYVTVTATDGSTFKTYSLIVNRIPGLNNLVTTVGAISPVFSATTFAYTANTINATTTITPTTVDASYTVAINGAPAASGVATDPLPLTTGPNVFNIVITSQDGSSTGTYTLTITKKLTQTITFPASPTAYTTGVADFSPATSDSGLPITYTSSNTARISILNGKLHMVSAGTNITITANQPGNETYAAATAVVRIWSVTKGTPVITFDAFSAKFGDANFTPPAASTNTVTALGYTSSNASVATIASGKIHIVGVGTSEITASQASSTNYNAAVNVKKLLTVTKGNSPETITFPILPQMVFGDSDFAPGAISTNGVIPITYTSSNLAVATIESGNIHIVGPGTSTITASQATGTSNYLDATPVARTLIVDRIPSTTSIAFNTLPTVIYGTADFAPSASSTDAVTPINYASSNPAVATIVNGNIHIVGVGTTNITASQATGDASNADAQSVQVLSVDQATLQVTADAKSKSYGDVNPTLTYQIQGFVPGDDITKVTTLPTLITSATSTSTPAGSPYPITPSGAVAANYNFSYTGASLTVTPANLTITATGTAKPYGTALSSGNSTSNFTTSTTKLGEIVKNVTLTADAAALDPAALGGSTYVVTPSAATGIYGFSENNYNINYIPFTGTVSQAGQTITFAALANKAFGDAGFALTATGGASGNAVTYTSSDTNVATVSGSTVTIVGAGTTTITASQLGNGNYTAAIAVDQALTIDKGTQTITFAALANKAFGDASFALTATGGTSGNTVTYTSSDTNVATVSGSMVTIVGVGSTTITASQLGNGNYTAAASVDQELAVGKAAQTITFATLANKAFGDASFALTATGGASGNTVTYTSSDTNVATVSGSTVTIVGVGTTTITASQLGNGNYTAAASVDQELTVGKAAQTITFATITDKNINSANFEPGATTTSGLVITYTSSNTAVATVFQDLADGNKWKVKVVGIGTTDITAVQVGNNNYDMASLIRTLTVVPVTLPVTLTSYTAKTDGNRARLVWTTASEQNNDRFEVERSVDGRIFTYMTTVRGNGTTSNSHTYTVYDNSPANETTYYRLKQYDLDGKVEDLGVRSVTFKVEAVVGVKAFPNPTADVVNLSFANYRGQNAKVVITDVLGRTIHTETILLTTGASNYKLNLNGKLMPGQYFINVTGENLKTVIKLIAY